MSFFVVGLPRSRTAWLSVFLECHHEAMQYCSSLDEYYRTVDGVGDAGTGLMLLPKLPGPTLIVHRDGERAREFTQEVYGYDAEIEYRILRKKMDKLSGWHINYDDIDNYLEEIWIYLRNEPFDRDRAERLKALKIEVRSPETMEINPTLVKELMESTPCLG